MNPRGHRSPTSIRRRCAAPLLAGLCVLAGCASTPPTQQKPTPEQYEKLAEAEKAWRAEAPEYPALRDELVADPVTAAWLTRMFVNVVVTAREPARAIFEQQEFQSNPTDRGALDRDLRKAVHDGSRAGDFRYLAARGSSPSKRAVTEIGTLGAAAVPVLVADLLLSEQSHLRTYGVELLGYVGPAAVPALVDASRTGRAAVRGAAAEVLGRLAGEPAALARLGELVTDAEFTVRADAARGLQHGGAVALDLLCPMLQDVDPFVRSTAATALGGHPGRRSALALADFLLRCEQDAESRGFEAAQKALMAMAQAKGPRRGEAWRRWAEMLPE